MNTNEQKISKPEERLIPCDSETRIAPAALPWFNGYVKHVGGSYYQTIYNHQGIIGTLNWMPVDMGNGSYVTNRHVNGELIVKAVNNFEPMQKRIKELEEALSKTHTDVLNVYSKLPATTEGILQSVRQIMTDIQQVLQSSKQL